MKSLGGFLLLLVALLAGCAQTTTVQRTAVDDNVSRNAEPADADRRAAVRLELAAGYFSSGQFDTALGEITLALAAKPDYGAAFNMRGLIHAARGEDQLADESFQRALALNPRDADAMHNRAWFLCQRGRFDEADRLFEQVIALPQYRDVLRSLVAQGICLARGGNLMQAEAKMLRAYEFDPGNPNTAFALADVLYRRNEVERARFYIRRVNDRDELVNAQSLWLAMRIENRAGNRQAVDMLGRQLRGRFPQSPEARLYDQGRFND